MRIDTWRRVGLVVAVVFAHGCATAQRTTRITVNDLEAISHAMAASLAASDALGDRNRDSPVWIVSIDKVQNLSSDVMTESEQWSVIARLRSSLPIQALWDQKNVRFVIPVDRLESLRHAHGGDWGQGFGTQRRPTHQMAATFRSITRAGAENRTDLYFCEFQILDLVTGEPVWSDKFEYKRAAAGHILD